MTTLLPMPVESIFEAFELLKNDVARACRTQIGDAARLGEQLDACNRFHVSVTQVRVALH